MELPFCKPISRQYRILFRRSSIPRSVTSSPQNTPPYQQSRAIPIYIAYVKRCALRRRSINELDFLANRLRPNPPPRQDQSSDSEDDESSDNEDLKPGDPRPGHSSNVQHRLVVAAAAFGDLEYLQGLVIEPQALYLATIVYFPSVLHAAVINMHIQIVNWILERPGLETTRRPDNPGTVNTYIEALGGALEVAARTNQTRLGLMVAEHSLHVQQKRGIVSYYWLDGTISSASVHGDGESFLKLTTCRARLEGGYCHRYMITNGLGVDAMGFVRDTSHNTTLYLLRKGSINPNQFDHHAPIRLALMFRRYGLFRLFLDFGANVDARAYGGFGRTALKYELSESRLWHVLLLVDNGADPLNMESAQVTGTIIGQNLANKMVAFAIGNDGSRVTWDDWQAFWQIEREGLSNDTRDRYERIAATLNDVPYVSKKEDQELK